jgi:trehalose 6-phosphate phosphatase
MQRPPLPDRGCALFFDFDGTLAELAPRPEVVQVHPALPHQLALAARALGGALAVISGRPVSEIDHHLRPLRLPVAGVHGAERRGPDGFLRRIAAPDLGPAREHLQALVDAHPALRLEVKPGALALHYRQAEKLEDLCVQAMAEAQQRVDGMAMMCGKKVVELKPRRANKGQALRAFMDERPFRRRRPWMFGDDVTDEAAFESVLDLGGVAVKVGEGDTLATWRLDGPAELQAWLAEALLALGVPAAEASSDAISATASAAGSAASASSDPPDPA